MDSDEKIKVFPGKVHIQLDKAVAIKNGIKVPLKNKFSNNSGTILQSHELETGSKVLFFVSPKAGIIIEGTCIINYEDIYIIKNGMDYKLLGKRILVIPEMEESELLKNIVKSEAHRKPLPKGVVKSVGDDCAKVKAGDIVIFDIDRKMDFTKFELHGKETAWVLKEDDVHMILP